METRTVNKVVRIVALDPLYTRVSFDFAPVRGQNGKFITGQESILTAEQMTGNANITAKQKAELRMGDNPYIINPDDTYPLHHARPFDLSYIIDEKDNFVEVVNSKDYAEFTFFAAQ